MNLNLKAKQNKTFDAIVIGSGITGGWAAKELSEKGLKTLILERGRDVKHIADYTTAELDTWDLPNRGQIAAEEVNAHYFKQVRSGNLTEANKQFFVKDDEHPYQEKVRFDWFRGYHLGGSSLTWDRQTYRFSDLDFEANSKDGIGVDWPIRYKDLEPWYAYVERFIGVAGEKLSVGHLPDGDEMMSALSYNCVERHMKSQIESRWDDRKLMVNRVANLSEYYELFRAGEPNHGKRQKCMMRNRCDRGCPYGGYFSSLSSTLPAALATGNLTIATNKYVTEVLYNEETQKADGVRVINTVTGDNEEYFARVIFLCASTVDSAAILMNSKSGRFPNGLGNDSGELGHNLMDQHAGIGLVGSTNDFQELYYKGRRPTGFNIHRFVNTNASSKSNSFVRGFSYDGIAQREGWGIDFQEIISSGIGLGTKERIMRPPSNWTVRIQALGEMLPYHQNHFYLDETQLDNWGIPQLHFDAGYYGSNEVQMRQKMLEEAQEIFSECRIKVSVVVNDKPVFGRVGRVVGSARMGKDANESICNGNNQVHGCKNVFLTDGACLPSSGTQSPDLTLMAITCRAVDFAVNQMKKTNI
ncbi:MAG: GMC family oxidoreductase [Cytophagia bacterium]|nr:GMC family oxidoreductase [Cytophagia bacterium]NVK43757.1 GMC family oxidoreductase [Oceanospirillaceae bacterium]